MSGSEEDFSVLLNSATKGNKRAKTLLKEALDIFKQYRVFLPDPCDCFVSAMQELRNYEYRPPHEGDKKGQDSDAMEIDSHPNGPASGSHSDDASKPHNGEEISNPRRGISVSSLVDDASVDSSEACQPLPSEDSNIPNTEVQERIKSSISQSREKQPLKCNEVRVAVSSLEAPSYTVVWRFLNKVYGMNFRFEVELLNPPASHSFDPRQPVEEIKFLAWKYCKIRPKPAIGAPKLLDVMRILQPISTIARSEFDVSRWMRQSERIAKEIIIPAFQVIEQPIAKMLIGLALHAEDFFPLPETWGIPSGARHAILIETQEPHVPVWTWIYSVYVVIVMVMAAVLPSNLTDSSLESWKESLQYQTLHSLLLGPMDWLVDAAIIALGRLALDRSLPSFVESEVCRLLLLRAQSTPAAGYVCYRKVLLCHLIMLPSIRAEQRITWIKSLKKQL